MHAQAGSYSPGIANIAFTVVGLTLTYVDVRTIQAVGWAIRMGDVVEVSPPLWLNWVRVLVVGAAVLVVVASELASFLASRG